MSHAIRPTTLVSTVIPTLLLALIGIGGPASAAVVEINGFEPGLGSTANVW